MTKRTLPIGILCLLAGFWLPAAAQVSITKGDVESQLAVGKVVTNVADSTTNSADIGTKGSSAFNFSGLLSQGATVYTSVAVGSTPYASHYPGATHAMHVDTSLVYLGQRIFGTVYQYFTVGPNLTNLGAEGVSTSPQAGISLRIKYLPADIQLSLPVNFGGSWTSTFTDSTYIDAGIIKFSTGTNHNATYTVDAYGPLTIPGGSVHQALRIRKVDNGVVTYIFISPDGSSVILNATDPASPDSGIIGVQAITWSGPVPTAVAEGRTVPTAFSLAQNYPNPFNPATVIRYALPKESEVSLVVYNAIGQTVATLVDGMVPAGEHEVRFDGKALSSGLYFYRLQAGSFVATRKMILVK